MLPIVKRATHAPSHETANETENARPPHDRVDGCPAPQVMSNLSGLWKGTLISAADDAETPFSLHQEKEQTEGAVIGRLAFAGPQPASADVQLLEASATTYVALVGPYYDPASNAEMVTVLEARTNGDRLYGTYSVRPSIGGRRTAQGRFVATRSSSSAAARAA